MPWSGYLGMVNAPAREATSGSSFRAARPGLTGRAWIKGETNGGDMGAAGKPADIQHEHDDPAHRRPRHGAGGGNCALARAHPRQQRILRKRALVDAGGYELLAALLRLRGSKGRARL